ncbi:NAD-dependent epimerase/dehydratase family protein [Candidatus Woesearchaeota archaeon]|nr:MAG: NAD-dependent epimerase/dehydratase family protein [Candidatus Woesearchaeota archaeon]
MKILVTGAAGFIGSSLVDKLLSMNVEVVGVDNFNKYYSVQRKESNVKNALNNEKFKLIKADVNDKDVMEDIFANEEIDKVVHLAARAGVRPSIEDPLVYEKDNIHALLVLLELAKKYKVKHFIFGSSSSVYGNNKKVPFAETDNVDHPISQYAATKKAGELLCYTYHHLYNLNVTCLRFFTVYGPRGRPDMAIYKFIDKIFNDQTIEVYGNGHSKRDYTYITDIVNGILLSLKKPKGYAIYNLGNSNTVELLYLVKLIENCVGKKANLKFIGKQPGDVDITYADLTLAKTELGYDPKIKIEEGIKKTVEWYMKQS